ncbi:MAG: hypothetical protein ABSB59_28930 [Streptosporangiaceae bacterium]
MLNQDQHCEPGASRRLSRRSVLRGAATAGAAGLAASGLAAAATAPAQAAPSRPATPDQPARELPAGPIVVHVRDARTGDIEVFSGTSKTRLRDQDLAARIARAIA